MQHVDAHYCAASWKYLREYAIKHRELVSLVSLDDKHKIKCGEPSYPVAAAERGKKVIVGENQVMAVADHDFTKFSLVPSVHMFVSQEYIVFVFILSITLLIIFYSKFLVGLGHCCVCSMF